MKLIITLQVCENYGAHDWDGKGECPQYWKNKGGVDVEVASLPALDITRAGTEALVEVARKELGRKDDYFEEFYIGHEWVADDALTESERYQVADFGEVLWPRRKHYVKLPLPIPNI